MKLDTPEKQFVYEMGEKFIKDKKLVESYKSLDAYILHELDDMIERGKMSDKQGKKIFLEMFEMYKGIS